MHVIVPEAITDGSLVTSNVAETDYAAWSNVTPYAIGNRVILTTGYHRVYECIAAHTGRHPVTDPLALTTWIKVSATNRWKAFDEKLSDPVTRSGSITYTLAPTALVDSLVFLGLLGSTVRVIVRDGATAVFDQTFDLVDRTDAVDWFTWFFDPIQADSELMMQGFAALVGQTIEVTITSAGTVQVGEIVMGRDRRLGDTNVGTGIGIRDYSRKDRDDFGNAIIVKRAFSDLSDFKFTLPATDARRVKRILADLRATAAVYHAGADTTMFGTTVYGFYTQFDIPLTDRAISFASLQVEGLV